MSEQDVRKILNEVIADLDACRVVPPRRGRLARLGLGVGAPAALALGLALGGCDEPMAAYGVPPVDSSVQDTGVKDAGPDGNLDDGAVVDYGGPDVDGGADGGVDGGRDGG